MTTKQLLASLVLATLAGVFGAAASAQTWDETTNGGGDAGELLGNIQVVSGSGALTSITGNFPAQTDRDLYYIRISNPAAFSASTATGSVTNDTVLYLFNSAGVGIAQNDDISGSSFLSTLPVGNGLYAGLPAGIYIIAAVRYYNHPQSSSGDIWSTATAATTTVNGPLNTNPLTGWTSAFSFGVNGAYTITLTGCEFIAPITQRFDGVTAPALPAGWTAGGHGTSGMFATLAFNASSQPNCVFVSNPGSLNDRHLTSPTNIARSGANVLTFRHAHAFENTFDGGILEISIGGAAFREILSAGGSFVQGGYSGLLSANFGNSIGSFPAWTGTASSYFTTVVNLPASASGQTVAFRWRMCADSSVGATGWSIDDIFFNPPMVTDVSPRSGAATGGTAITVTGTDFTGATAVVIDGIPCTAFTVVSPTSITCTTPPGVLGRASSVVVRRGTVAESVTGPQTFTYTGASSPTVSAVAPPTGPTNTTTAVTITGTNFVAGATVSFGGVAATTVVVVNSTTITCNAPANVPGPASVVVTQSGNRSAQNALFTYTAALPTVTSVTGSPGPSTASKRVSVAGTGFFGVTSVTFNGNAATEIITNAAGTVVSCLVPPGAVATNTPVLVTAAGGTNVTNTFWSYAALAAPTFTSITPATGPTSGGTQVFVRGTNFFGVTGVTINGIAATGVLVNQNGTSIQCVVPAGTGAGLSVVVTTAAGSNPANTAWTYAAPAAPTVTSLSVTTGTVAGDTSVTITGTNFLGATAVTFGGVAVKAFSVSSATNINVITAPGTAGTGLSVLVTTPGGTNAANTLWSYTALVAPTVTAISPNAGLDTGALSVTITGTSFVSGATVTVGGVACTSVVVHNANTITCVTGSGMAAGTASVLVTTSAGTNAANTLFTVIATSAPPTITSGAPAAGQIGVAYNHNFTATGNPATFTWTVTTGTLPAGLTLSTAGVLSGTPTGSGGVTNFTVTVTNGIAPDATQNVALTINEAPAITSGAPAAGTVGTSYNHNFTASGFPAPTFALFSGTLPGGLTLAAGGTLSGTPTAPGGIFTFTVRASNGIGTPADQVVNLTINEAPSFTSGAPAAGQIGTSYSHNFTAGGYPAPTFSVTAGTLPAGLSLSSGGALTGTPTGSGGVANFTVTASNGIGTPADQVVALTINEAPAITSAAPAGGVQGVPYTHNYTASGFPATFTFTVTSGALPTGLTLSGAGAITGTPTTIGNFTGVVTCSNGIAPDATQPFNITIAPAGPTILTSTAGPLALGTTTQGIAGTPANYTVQGISLTADISITPPAGVEISLAVGGPYQTTALTLTQSGGSVAVTTIHVRIAASASVGAVTGNITHASTGATTQNVSVSGTMNPGVPEINVQRASANVLDGSTDAIGNVPFGVAQTVTYTIQNLGFGGLNITTTPILVAISNLSNVTSATLTTPPTATVAGGGSTTFTITYTVTAAAPFSFDLSIDNNDSDEGTYNWTVSGTGASMPEIDVTRTAAVANGGTDTATGGTAGAALVLTYTVQNIGNSPLTITNPVTIAGLTNCTATVTTAPSGTVAAATSTTLVITVTPTAAGSFGFTVSMVNDDADENPYAWTVAGTAAAKPGKKDDGGCSTGNGQSWLMLAGLLAALGVALRSRKARA